MPKIKKEFKDLENSVERYNPDVYRRLCESIIMSLRRIAKFLRCDYDCSFFEGTLSTLSDMKSYGNVIDRVQIVEKGLCSYFFENYSWNFGFDVLAKVLAALVGGEVVIPDFNVPLDTTISGQENYLLKVTYERLRTFADIFSTIEKSLAEKFSEQFRREEC